MIWQHLRESWLRFAGLWRRRRHERDLADELEFHLAMKISAGQSSEQARIEFGGLEKWKEVCRDVGRWRPLDELGRDVVFALRMLRKSPVFTVVAIVTLTLAIGANTAVFTLLNALMLKSVPVPNVDRLAIFRIQPDKVNHRFSYPLFQSLERKSRPVMRTFAFSDRSFNLHTGGGLEAVPGQLVSGEYLPALGLSPELGRWIEPHDDRPGVPDGMVAVISDRFWRTRMSTNPRALGQKITLNRAVFTVIGVMPKGFRGMDRDRAPDVFLPLQAEPFVDSPFSLLAVGNRAWWLSVGGLLNDRVSLKLANVFLETKSFQLFAAVIPALRSTPGGYKVADVHLVAERGANGLSDLRLRFRKPLIILMGLVVMVLLIACLNLTTLLTARTASRGREISTRSTLGATRARLLRQLLTESLLLSLIGTALGLAAAPALARLIAAVLSPQRGPSSPTLEVVPDLAVFAFTAFLTVLATVLGGTLPAVRSTHANLQTVVREASPSIQNAERRSWWQRLLLALEVALSLMLVTGATSLGFSLVKLHRAPLGFEPHGLVFFTPQGRQPILEHRLMLAYKQVVEQIRNLPNVQAASVSVAIPANSTYIPEDVHTIAGRSYNFEEDSVGPDYFRTLRTPLLIGREFKWTDREGAEQKIILNRSAAQLLFRGGGTPLGQHLLLGGGNKKAEVVGVVADSTYLSIRDAVPPMIYTAAMQGVIPGASLSIVVRTNGPLAPLTAAIRKSMKRLIPEVPLPIGLSMNEYLADSLATERIMSTLTLFFGGLALLITAIGLYGTLAYSTERRTGEIGIRLALGASRLSVIQMVSAENGFIALLGCLAGLTGSRVATKTVASLLYGVSPHSPAIFAATAILVFFVAAAASPVPAIKASQIDPLSAIRHE